MAALKTSLYCVPVINFRFSELPAKQHDLISRLVRKVEQALIQIFYLYADGVDFLNRVLGLLNRDGPGVVCTAPNRGMHCTEQWAPWPFWLIGAVLVLIPVILFGHLRRRAHRGPAA